MYTEAKMNSALLRSRRITPMPVGTFILRKLHAATDCPPKDPTARASCYDNRVEGDYYLTLGLQHRLPEPFSSWNRVCSARMFRLQRWPVSKRVNRAKADADDATLLNRRVGGCLIAVESWRDQQW